jgi:hypothetical protein
MKSPGWVAHMSEAPDGKNKTVIEAKIYQTARNHGRNPNPLREAWVELERKPPTSNGGSDLRREPA